LGFPAILPRGLLNHDNLHREGKDATFFDCDRLRIGQFRSVGFVHQAARACDLHFLSRGRIGLSHALGYRVPWKNEERPFVNFK
jgi:hypothetical protein